MAVSFASLPPDLVRIVVSHLPWHDRMHAAESCSVIHTIADDLLCQQLHEQLSLDADLLETQLKQAHEELRRAEDRNDEGENIDTLPLEQAISHMERQQEQIFCAANVMGHASCKHATFKAAGLVDKLSTHLRVSGTICLSRPRGRFGCCPCEHRDCPFAVVPKPPVPVPGVMRGAAAFSLRGMVLIALASNRDVLTEEDVLRVVSSVCDNDPGLESSNGWNSRPLIQVEQLIEDGFDALQRLSLPFDESDRDARCEAECCQAKDERSFAAWEHRLREHREAAAQHAASQLNGAPIDIAGCLRRPHFERILTSTFVPDRSGAIARHRFKCGCRMLHWLWPTAKSLVTRIAHEYTEEEDFNMRLAGEELLAILNRYDDLMDPDWQPGAEEQLAEEEDVAQEQQLLMEAVEEEISEESGV